MRAHNVLTWWTGVSPSPSPSPSGDPTSSSTDGFVLAIVLVFAAIAVVALALMFTLSYHEKLFKIIGERTGQPIGTERGAAIGEQSPTIAAANLIRADDPKIVGPDEWSPSKRVAYAVEGVQDAETVTWQAERAEPKTGQGKGFVTTFAEPGCYTITASHTVDGQPVPLPPKTVSIVAPAAKDPAKAAAGAPAIILPFVVNNWGRLVVVIFGVGVIAALMAFGALEAAAGVGILGTLLGVGAVTATAGSGGGNAPPAKEDPAKEDPKAK